MSRLQTYYNETVVPQLKEQLGFDNVMQVPRIQKITLNMGVGEAVTDKKVMDRAVGAECPQVGGQLQDSRRLARWLQGDTAQGTDV
jgi:large subunit ribosomal protein L5